MTMIKEAFKAQYRQSRIAANGGIGVRIGKLMSGEATATFDNSHIWDTRNRIAAEVAPDIRKRQLAWVNGGNAEN